MAATLFVAATSGLAQTPVKCQDKNGRIVYVDRDCEVYGLRNIGPVQDRTTVMPSNPDRSEGNDTGSSSGGGMQACRSDAQRFCRTVKPGGGAVIDCLIDHQDDITEDCYQFLKARQKNNK